MKKIILLPFIVSVFTISAFEAPRLKERIAERKENRAIRMERKGGGIDIPKAQRETININGLNRTFIIKNESRTANKKPLMIVLHGGGGNADYSEYMSQFTPKALKENFIVIYPDGSGKQKDKFLTWNSNHCCGYAMENNIDDISLISKLIDKAILEYGADPKRIYLSGMSNGAMMTHMAAMALPNKITAIGTVVGTLFGDEKMPKAPVPALIINGLKDDMVPFNGGGLGKISRAWDGTPMKPADYQAEFWAKANNCSQNYQTKESENLIRRTYNCTINNSVEQIIVKDGGHSWFGGNKWNADKISASNSINATDEIWSFVSKHSR